VRGPAPINKLTSSAMVCIRPATVDDLLQMQRCNLLWCVLLRRGCLALLVLLWRARATPAAARCSSTKAASPADSPVACSCRACCLHSTTQPARELPAQGTARAAAKRAAGCQRQMRAHVMWWRAPLWPPPCRLTHSAAAAAAATAVAVCTHTHTRSTISTTCCRGRSCCTLPRTTTARSWAMCSPRCACCVGLVGLLPLCVHGSRVDVVACRRRRRRQQHTLTCLSAAPPPRRTPPTGRRTPQTPCTATSHRWQSRARTARWA
jgi:hypothetical protein